MVVAYGDSLPLVSGAFLADEPQQKHGGVSQLVAGRVGVAGDELMVRVGPDRYETALAQPHARMMDFTGRSMKGMVFVGPEGLTSEDALAAWVGRGTEFASSLPAK